MPRFVKLDCLYNRTAGDTVMHWLANENDGAYDLTSVKPLLLPDVNVDMPRSTWYDPKNDPNVDDLRTGTFKAILLYTFDNLTDDIFILYFVHLVPGTEDIQFTSPTLHRSIGLPEDSLKSLRRCVCVDKKEQYYEAFRPIESMEEFKRYNELTPLFWCGNCNKEEKCDACVAGYKRILERGTGSISGSCYRSIDLLFFVRTIMLHLFSNDQRRSVAASTRWLSDFVHVPYSKRMNEIKEQWQLQFNKDNPALMWSDISAVLFSGMYYGFLFGKYYPWEIAAYNSPDFIVDSTNYSRSLLNTFLHFQKHCGTSLAMAMYKYGAELKPATEKMGIKKIKSSGKKDKCAILSGNIDDYITIRQHYTTMDGEIEECHFPPCVAAAVKEARSGMQLKTPHIPNTTRNMIFTLICSPGYADSKVIKFWQSIVGNNKFYMDEFKNSWYWGEKGTKPGRKECTGCLKSPSSDKCTMRQKENTTNFDPDPRINCMTHLLGKRVDLIREMKAIESPLDYYKNSQKLATLLKE